MEGLEALHRLTGSGVSLVGLGRFLEGTPGHGPHPSHIRPAGQPGSPRPQLARGRLLPPYSTVSKHPLDLPQTPACLGVPGSGIPKTKFNRTKQSQLLPVSKAARQSPASALCRSLSKTRFSRVPRCSGRGSPAGRGRLLVARASASWSRVEDRAPAGFGCRSAGCGDPRGGDWEGKDRAAG